MCHFSSYQWGGVPAILNIMCMFIRHESEAQSLSPHYNKKVGKHFSIPSVPSPFAPLSSPGWRVCPHLCWDNLLEYPDFPSLICLKEINGHYVAKLIPNRNCHYLVSQLIELTQRETPPKAIPDLIITIQWDMKHKTDKNHFDHQRHFVHFLWASNRGQQIYDIRIVQDNQKLGFQKKAWVGKKIWV